MQFLLSQCHVAFVQYPSEMLTLLLAGLMGGMTHCAGMCGPFVMAQMGPSHEVGLAKLKGAALLPYHLGRMTTYIVLGVIAALLSKQLMGTPLERGLSVVFLTLAGLIFIGSALPSVKRWLAAWRISALARMVGQQLGNISGKWFHEPKHFERYGLGVMLGLLPCGLVFAALMVVATMGNPAYAALGMALFAVGTMPSLVLVGLIGKVACNLWPRTMGYVARGAMLFNGFSLFVLAGRMVLTKGTL